MCSSNKIIYHLAFQNEVYLIDIVEHRAERNTSEQIEQV